jgi:hypothetical protein
MVVLNFVDRVVFPKAAENQALKLPVIMFSASAIWRSTVAGVRFR